MFRTVLVPVDRSPFAETAIPHAAEVARRNGGTLHLVMVHSITVPDALRAATLPPGGTLDAEIRREEERYLDELAIRVAAKHDVRPLTTLLDGTIAHAIDHFARDNEVDLVVLSTHGRSGLERAWLGSVADRLVRTLTVPLLLVRPELVPEAAEIGGFHRVLVGLDGSALAEDALRAAAALAAPGATCTALRVAVPPQGPGSPYIPDAARVNREILAAAEELAAEYLAELAVRMRGEWSGFETRVVAAHQPARVIVDAAVELQVDLIAIATHGRGPVMRALIGSVTDRVVRLAPVPVLVVPAHASAAHLVTGHRTSMEREVLTG